MTDTDWLAEQFERHRPRLRAMAVRMLGSGADAEDAVQEAWLRVTRAGTDAVENLGGWLTTIVSRVALDMLRSRKTRNESPLDAIVVEVPIDDGRPGHEHDVELADAIGPALMVVLDTLSPLERLAFVLHDLFGVPFDEIAPIVGRSPAAARQLASRARRRVRGADAPSGAREGQRAIVDAFLAASREGKFDELLALLNPEVVLHADGAAVAMGATATVHGARAVAETFAGRARFARPALIDGVPGAVWAPAGRPRVVFAFQFAGDHITGIELIADRDRIKTLDLHLG
jgi:RNA polymerase sigma factor (sigma-70 family)